MPKGAALTIGLNAVDPKHYQGWDGQLTACEADARDMAAVAAFKGFSVMTLLTKQATRAAVTKAVAAQAKGLVAGDIFLLSYSGHGGQIPDLNGDEPDRQDETWCLYDGELIDDEIYAALGAFVAGVRVLVFSDSCHSGTVVKAAWYAGRSSGPPARYRAMPAAVGLRTFEANRAFYEPILKNRNIRGSEDAVKASVILISGCQDNQFSADGEHNGLFTGTMLGVWNGGKFKGTYKAFHRAILDRMPPDQSPRYFKVGKPNARFTRQKVFTV